MLNKSRFSIASKPINTRWIRTGSPPYCKPFIAPYYSKFSTNIKILLKVKKLIPVLLARAFGSSGLTKLILIFQFLISAES